MDDEAEQRRAERAAQADYHVAAQQRRDAAESVKAQVLIDRFVERANAAGLPTEELTASPWSGRGRYRTGVSGWYLKRNRSIGVSTDGGYYVLIVAPERFGRWRGVSLPPTPRRSRSARGAGTVTRSPSTSCWTCAWRGMTTPPDAGVCEVLLGYAGVAPGRRLRPCGAPG